MDWKDAMRRALHPERDALEAVIFDADPLIVVGEGYEIEYPGRTKVEFQPGNPEWTSGVATAPLTNELSLPVLHVQDKIDYPISLDPHVRTRGGFTLIGIDAEGRPASWYFGKAADDYIRNRAVVEDQV